VAVLKIRCASGITGEGRYGGKQTLSPTEWQSVSDSLVELSERIHEASSSSQPSSACKGGNGGNEGKSSSEPNKKSD